MSTTFAIQPIQAEDLPACATLIKSAMQHGMAKAYTPQQLAAVCALAELPVLQYMLERPHPLNYAFSISCKGKVCGFSFGRGSKINMMFIAPEAQGQGAGRALLRHILQWLQTKNVAWVWLHAAPNAVQFYKKCGFQAVEESHFMAENVKIPTTFMQQFLRVA